MSIGTTFLGWSPLIEGQNIYQTPTATYEYNLLEFGGDGELILDEVYVDGDSSIPSDVLQPQVWGIYTVMIAQFKDTLEAGNLVMGTQTLTPTHIWFQRRDNDGMEWETVKSIIYNEAALQEKLHYEFFDLVVRNGYTYQYSAVPIVEAPFIVGNRISLNEITIDFEGIWLTDDETNYQLLAEIDFADVSHNIGNSVKVPLNSQYPSILTKKQNYKSGSVAAMYITSTTLLSGVIGVKNEKEGRTKFLSWLKNGQPKLLRDATGEKILFGVIGQPRESYEKARNGLASVSFDFCEIGDSDDYDTLLDNGIIKVDDLV